MGIFKNLVCHGTHYYLCGVRDQRIWNHLIIADLGISSEPFLNDLWAWGTKCAHRRELKRIKLQNCWEFMRCGHGGGKCKASAEAKLHGIHGGQNAGRACWVVTSTLCRDRNHDKCRTCEFYHKVHDEQRDYILDDKALKTILRMKW